MLSTVLPRVVSSITVLAVFSAASSGTAGLILDQSFDGGSKNSSAGVGGGVFGPTDQAQVFTVGIAGQLAQISVLIIRGTFPADDLLLDVRPTVGGVPTESDTAVLASAAIHPASVPIAPPTGGVPPEFVTVDISSFGVHVTPGEELAIVLRSPTTQSGEVYAWFGQGNFPPQPAPYAGGDSFFRNAFFGFPTWTADDSLAPVVHTSRGFETFVDAPIPEPSTLVLSSLMLGVFGVARLAERLKSATGAP